MADKNYTILLITFFAITSCGGGGGGGSSYNSSNPGYGTGNYSPEITNASANISVQENQTSAFTVTASDADGDALTFSISGTDSSLFTIGETSGIVAFITAPDYEAPSDENTDNVYSIIATVSDGTATDNMMFNINVTNDASDDTSSENFDGKIVASGPIQSASVCFVESISDVCSEAQFNTTSAQDGTFQLVVDGNPSGFIKTEGGFDPNTNWEILTDEGLAIGQPTTDQNFIISPMSTMMLVYDNNTEYEVFKSKLGINSDFMIRFDDPFDNLNTETNNKVAVVYAQMIILGEVLKEIHTYEDKQPFWIAADNIYNRSGDETSLADTTFIKDMLANLDADFNPTSDQLVDLSAGISSFLQKIYADTSNTHSSFVAVGVKELEDLMESVVNGTADATEIDKLIFNTNSWIAENTSWDGGLIVDNEEHLRTTTYSLSNEGSSNYLVDQINPKTTDFIIYVKEGDIIKFDAASSVTSNHPFLLSTEVDDRDDSAQIGTNEGWDKDTLTLTVSANTPDEIYPYCDFHAGMYTNGKIVKVDNYNVANLDVTNASGALQVKGTVATGPFKGASGFTYKVYLTRQDSSDHEHTFYEYPNLTFYMPNDQGYHGSENASNDELFKPKSHYVGSSGTNDSDSGY
jgi:hypothetical protein